MCLARWNFTYLMLKSALTYQIAFDRSKDEDMNCLAYFEEDENGRNKAKTPNGPDWVNAKVFDPFLGFRCCHIDI